MFQSSQLLLAPRLVRQSLRSSHLYVKSGFVPIAAPSISARVVSAQPLVEQSGADEIPKLVVDTPSHTHSEPSVAIEATA